MDYIGLELIWFNESTFVFLSETFVKLRRLTQGRIQKLGWGGGGIQDPFSSPPNKDIKIHKN